MEKATVVVIGGGATGVGILRDLSMRGVDTLLVEKCDLVNGASSRYHGLLHSGGRYAVKDQEAAEHPGSRGHQHFPRGSGEPPRHRREDLRASA